MKTLIIGVGYIGSVLFSMLEDVTGFDLHPVDSSVLTGDIQDIELLEAVMEGKDAVIYLAGITDSAEIEKNLTRHDTVNLLAFPPIIRTAKKVGVKRFIYASSVAAYGTSEEILKESDFLEPTTLYGHAKKRGETWVQGCQSDKFVCVRVRSASVCGPSRRLANHLTVNKMVHDGLTKGIITVNGGEQTRCHIHIRDICSFYKLLLEAPAEKISGQAFNVVSENQKVIDTAKLVASILDCKVEIKPRSDNRSYKVSGEKAYQVLGFWPQWTVPDAVQELKEDYENSGTSQRRIRSPSLWASDTSGSSQEVGRHTVGFDYR